MSNQIFRKTINSDLFDFKLIIVVADNVLSYYNMLVKKYSLEPQDMGEVHGFCITINMKHYEIVLRNKDLTHNLTHHETYHAVTKIATDRGIKDDESQAYLSGWIIEVMYKFFEDKGLKIRHSTPKELKPPKNGSTKR